MSESDSDAELNQLRRDNAQLRAEVDALQRSLSWRLTSPLRRVANSLRRGAVGRLFAPDEQPIERPLPPVTFRFDAEVVIFALLPAAQAGGGQRSAQLARAYSRRGTRVRYFYAADSFNFAQGAVERLSAPSHLARHAHVAEVSPRDAFAGLHEGSLVVFEAPHPRFSPYLEAARAAGLRIVFELIDDWDTSLGADWYSPALLQRFVDGATLVTGTAKVLREQLATRFGRPDAVYLPNAADDAIFRPRAWPRPGEFSQATRVLLYVGTLSGEWLSWEHLAAAGRVEGATVYLIGDLPHQRALPPGVVSLGPRAVTDVPRYLAHASAALIPFKPGALTDAVSPVKVFEYLFMRAPVVATPMRELEGMVGVTTAESPEEFARACGHASAPDDDASVRFRVSNTWAARAEALDVEPESSVSWFVRGDGPHERAMFSIRQHFGREAVLLADAERFPPAVTRFVAVLDARRVLLSATPLRQLRLALLRDVSAGAARSSDGALTLFRSTSLAHEHSTTVTLDVATTGIE